jgi:hypothetical protein
VYIKLSLSLKCKAAIFFALFKVFINALSRMQQRVVGFMGLQQFTLSMCFYYPCSDVLHILCIHLKSGNYLFISYHIYELQTNLLDI